MNPIFLLRVLRSYLSDIDRIWRFSNEQLKAYQDKALRKIIKYAYTVPLYRDKYRYHGIRPSDIKGIDDISKLPFITKDDLRSYFPDGIIPNNFNKKHSFLVSTSGSTGKPVFVYYDMFSAIKSLEGFARELKAYGGDWRKSKILLVIDLSPGSAENVFFTKSTIPFLKKFVSLKNIKYLHMGEKPEDLIKKINEFQPEFLGSDPNILRQIAYLKNNGYGKDITPCYIFSSGSMLDSYTKRYVENAFNVKLLETYGTTEGGPIAFECLEGGYHVHSDFIYLEILNDNKHTIPHNTPGHTIITKLYGGGTPIIRYTGIDDIATQIEKTCSCGIMSQMIKNIEGRATELIILPNGKTLSPLTLTGIPAKTMEDFNSYKIKQFQIIQHKIDELEILIVIDAKQRNIGISTQKLLQELKKRFSVKMGTDINITVKETKEIQKDSGYLQEKIVISKVKRSTN